MCNDPLTKKYLDKRILSLHARVIAFFDTVEEKIINVQWIISTTQTPFSRQRTVLIKITDSWCYKESNEGHTATRYTRRIEFKESTY